MRSADAETAPQPGRRRAPRLNVDARRRQLIEASVPVFASRPYDEISIEDIAAEAGVSKGLLYHYFSGKRELYVEVMRDQMARVWDLTQPDPELPALERLRATLDGYLDYVEAHAQGYASFHRGAMGGNAEVRAAFDEAQARQADRILEAMVGSGMRPELLRLAVRGWLNFMVTIVLQWVDDPSIERDQLRDLLAYSLVNVATAAGQADPSIEFAEPPPEMPAP